MTETQAIAKNRKARREYEILDTFECGLVLRGSEVKSLRDGKVQLAEAFARVVRGEVFLYGMHISPYSHASTHVQLDPTRERKLLLHKWEINRIQARVAQDRLTLIPLSLYFLDGRAKVELGLARGLKLHDQRQKIAKRDADREARRALSDRQRSRWLPELPADSDRRGPAADPGKLKAIKTWGWSVSTWTVEAWEASRGLRIHVKESENKYKRWRQRRARRLTVAMASRSTPRGAGLATI